MMNRLILFCALTVSASSAVAQPPQAAQRSAADAAKAFSLDLPAATPVPADSATTSPAVFTLDTPIEQLIADPKAKAVLDRDLPGLSGDDNLPKFKSMSLRQFQPMTGGQMTDALLAKTGADLAALGTGAVVAPVEVAPVGPAPTTHRKVDSGR